MSDLLSIGASGVRAYQTALSTVSENIANSGVTGYSKRSATLKAVTTVNGGLTDHSVAAGQGVALTGIARHSDALKVNAVRTAGADLAKTEAGVTWLGGIQSALTGNALDTRLTSFFTAARTLAADPTSIAARATMLEAGTSVAGAFAATGRALGQVATDLDATANQATATLTSLASQLAKVNDGLARTAPNSTASADLSDQRDQLLDQMSAITDVTVTTDANGRATVRVGGSNGPALVVGTEAGQVAYSRNDAGAVAFSIVRAGVVGSFTPAAGALAGIADAVGRVADARGSLGALANGFATTVNAIQAQGRDLDGNPGAAIFAAGTTATDLTMIMTDPRGIAAASAGGGQRDASNLAALDAARTGGGFEAGVTTLVSTNAATLAQRQTVAEAQGAIRDGAVTDLDAISGVSLDSEAVDLMRFQQAYSASSRVIQVARDVFQSILEIR